MLDRAVGGGKGKPPYALHIQPGLRRNVGTRKVGVYSDEECQNYSAWQHDSLWSSCRIFVLEYQSFLLLKTGVEGDPET